MSLVDLFKSPGKSGFGYASTAEEVAAGLDLGGRRVLITGCSSGLGQHAMKVLDAQGATIVGLARSEDKAKAAGQGLKQALVPVACELSEPGSVRAAVATVRAQGAPLDVIMCNAGIMALPKLETKHGLELQFLTNHIGHFLLVTGLLDQLAPQGRVVILSSEGHRIAPSVGIEFDNLSGERGYQQWKAYGQSKLANLLFARELSRRLPQPGQVANALHPGVIHTNLGRHMNGLMSAGSAVAGMLFFKSVTQGAATQVWAAAHPGAASINGEYLANCNVDRSSALGQDTALAGRLWEESERIAARLATT